MKNERKYELKHGQALVFVGDYDEKLPLARELAGSYGRFAEIGYEEIHSNYSLSNALENEPDVLIIVGFCAISDSFSRLKSLISSESVFINRKNEPARIVKPPIFIFCTENHDYLTMIEDDRRFFVV